MKRTRFEFPNGQGDSLAGLLEMPDDGAPLAMALFAHCFTCGKDSAAASRIARRLVDQGIAVLRFDFTGLGSSDGDFANTNFSSNIQDLLAAADYLGKHYSAPRLLIGHSLGGAAVLAAAQQIASIEAVATIAAPSTATHVRHLFADDRAEIERMGYARVDLAGRPFTVKAQFLTDLEQWNSAEHIGALRKALIIFHSPVDELVDVSEAAAIYQAAMHPKSFISLDDADHMLSRNDDAEYVANVLVAWAARYL
ncbi:MAG: putative redox protein [Halopseudomonas sp.]|jgi:putative redox protein|uniref:alpha/beta hydrolase family protein n=1 Tax=Halopseudomonas sp. TaxID=2901191 RepID=UPI0039E6CB2B